MPPVGRVPPPVPSGAEPRRTRAVLGSIQAPTLITFGGTTCDIPPVSPGYSPRPSRTVSSSCSKIARTPRSTKTSRSSTSAPRNSCTATRPDSTAPPLHRRPSRPGGTARQPARPPGTIRQTSAERTHLTQTAYSHATDRAGPPAAGWSVTRPASRKPSQRTRILIPTSESPSRLGLQALFQPPEQNAQAVPASGHRKQRFQWLQQAVGVPATRKKVSCVAFPAGSTSRVPVIDTNLLEVIFTVITWFGS